jgi:hypothetical protein
LILILYGCSDNPIEVSDTKWGCAKYEGTRKCVIEFVINNNSDFANEATVKIRAHRRRSIGEAVTNEVVGENTLVVRFSPNEIKTVHHEMMIKRKSTQIVVSAWAN